MEQELQSRSRQVISGPQIFHLLADFTAITGINIVVDFPVLLPFPCNTFFIESIKSGDEANTVLMYLKKLGLQSSQSFATNLTGTEQIFYLNTTLPAGPIYRTVVRFRDPITQFFLGVGTENGHTSRYTIGCTNDFEMQIRGGLYF